MVVFGAWKKIEVSKKEEEKSEQKKTREKPGGRRGEMTDHLPKESAASSEVEQTVCKGEL